MDPNAQRRTAVRKAELVVVILTNEQTPTDMRRDNGDRITLNEDKQ